MSYRNLKYVYSITNNANGKRYIGQTDNYEHRWNGHLSMLRGRRHHSKSLQRDFNKYGESVFSFELLEIRRTTERTSDDRELFWIKHFKTYTNIDGYNDNDPKAIAYISRECKKDYRSWFYPTQNNSLQKAISQSGLSYDYISGYCRLRPGDIEKILDMKMGIHKGIVSMILDCLHISRNDFGKYFVKRGQF